MRKFALGLVTGALALSLAGCGVGGAVVGGGGGGEGVDTVVSGVASAGIIKNGLSNVRIYALDADGGEALLKTTSTDARGYYAASIGSYSGALLVKVSGQYTDEATGESVTIPPDKPLRAALDSVSGAVTVAVTPLTELAVQKAGTLSAPRIRAANAVVNAQLGIDVVGTNPVEPLASALSTADERQKIYTLALAAISKMSATATADAVFSAIGAIRSDLSANGDGMSAAMKARLGTALFNYLGDTLHNGTGFTAYTVPAALLDVGPRTVLVRLSAVGVAGKLSGVDLRLDLPAGVTVVAGGDGSVAGAILSVAGGAFASAKYTAPSGSAPGKIHLALVSTSGFDAADFATLLCAVPGGATPAFTGSLVESGARILDLDGKAVSGAAVTVTAGS